MQPRKLTAFLVMILIIAGCAAPNPSRVKVRRMGTQGAGQANVFIASSGDTVERVARRNNLDIQTLLESNGLVGTNLLQPGQKLTLPVPQQIRVIEGDTIDSIARVYGLDRREIARENNLSLSTRLQRGQILRLPQNVTPTINNAPAMIASDNLPPVTEAVSAAPSGPITTTQSMAGSTIHHSASGTIMEEDLAPPPGAKIAAAPIPPMQTASAMPSSTAALPPVKTLPPLGDAKPAFSWPVNGNVLSGFGTKADGRKNDGLNIGAPLGSPVRVSAPGDVMYVGDNVKGFGNLILVRHSGGFATAYAHIQKPLVKRGDRVSMGQAIAQVGKSGNVDTPQLHFEIRKGTQSTDPTTYLP